MGSKSLQSLVTRPVRCGTLRPLKSSRELFTPYLVKGHQCPRMLDQGVCDGYDCGGPAGGLSLAGLLSAHCVAVWVYQLSGRKQPQQATACDTGEGGRRGRGEG